VAQAANSARGLQPRREVTLRAARPYLIAATAVAAVFAGVFALWPDQARFLLTRASAPFINLPNLSARDLLVSPGDAVILEGQRLQVEVDVPMRNVRRAYLRITGPDGGETAQEMTPLLAGSGGGRRFGFTCPPATSSFRYRVHAGDALSAFYTTTVVPRPAIEQLTLRYDFPSYARREPAVVEKAEGDIKALAGTRVTLTARTNKPMASAQLLVNGAPPVDAKGQPLAKTETAASGEGGPTVTCRFTLHPDLAGTWALRLVDEHGFESSSAQHLIEVVDDAAPTVAIIKPEKKQLRLPPNAPLPISYTIEDDVGLARAELLIEVDGRGRPPKPLALPPRGKKPARAVASDTALHLGTLNLRNAKYVTFQLKATDNCPRRFKGPHVGLSDVYRIELDVRAPSFAVAELMDQERKLRESLEKVKRELKAAKKESARLREELPKHKKPREKDQQRIDAMRKALASADTAARKAAQEMEGGYFDKLAEKVRELADQHIAKAENLAGQTKLAEEPAERGMLARETDRTIDRSLRMVDELMKQVEPVSDVVRRAIEMQEMAQREAELAREKLAEQAPTAAEPAMGPEQWQKAQQALARELGEMLKEMPGGQQAALAAAKQLAEAVAQEARRMAQEQAALAGQNPQLEKIQQLDKALGELAKQQQQLAQEAAAGAASAPQAQPMQQAAQDIQAGDLAQAVQNQAAAENALNQAAQQMAQGQQPGEQPAGQQGAEQGQPAGEQAGQEAQQAGQPGGEQGQQPQEAQQGAPQNAQQLADLAKRQGELREQTQALMEQRAQMAAEHVQTQLQRLQAEQAALAQQAEELAQNVGNIAPQAEQVGEQAAQAAGEAAQALQNNQVGEAAQAATQAGQQLGQLAEQLENTAAQPFGGQQQAAEQGQPAGQEAGQPDGEQGQPAGQEAGQQGGEQGQPAGQEAGQQGGEQGQPAGQEAGQQGGEQGQPAGQEAGQQGGEQGQPAGQEAGQQGGEQGQPAGQQAGQQGGQPGADQGATAQLAQQASGLAERQEQLAREIQALAAQNPLAQAAAEQARSRAGRARRASGRPGRGRCRPPAAGRPTGRWPGPSRRRRGPAWPGAGASRERRRTTGQRGRPARPGPARTGRAGARRAGAGPARPG